MTARHLPPLAARAAAVTLGCLLTAASTASAKPASEAPVLETFTPAGGPPGTSVTITARGLGPDTRVLYDGGPLPIVARPADGEVRVVVPRTATRSAAFVLVTGAGETRSGAWFQLELPAVVDSLSPTIGPPGTAITVRGSSFHGDETFRFGDADARVVDRQPWGVVLAAPEHGGALAYSSAGRAVVTALTFEVVMALTPPAVSPTEGPPGTPVRLRGAGLDGAVRVVYGGLTCRILARSPGELTVEIPANAAGEDGLWIEGLGQRVRSADVFHVTRRASR